MLLNKGLQLSCLVRSTCTLLRTTPRLRLTRHLVSTLPGAQPQQPPSSTHNDAGAIMDELSSVLYTDGDPKLRFLKRTRVLNIISLLKSFNITLDDLIQHVKLFRYRPTNLISRYNVLQECGHTNIGATELARFQHIVGEQRIKSLSWVDHDKLAERLCSYFPDVQLNSPKIDIERNTLRDVRHELVSAYLRKRLNMTEAQVRRLFTRLAPHSLAIRSLSTLRRLLDFLLNELQFSRERILSTNYLLCVDMVNVEQLLQSVPRIGERDTLDVLRANPMMMLQLADTIVDNLRTLHEYGSTDEAILDCQNVLLYSTERLTEGLLHVSQIEHVHSHPLKLFVVYRLIQTQNYESLKKLTWESLLAMSSRTTTAALPQRSKEYAPKKELKTYREVQSVYFQTMTGRCEADMRRYLEPQKSWGIVPVLSFHKTYQFLLSEGFAIKNIVKNAVLLLYPAPMVDAKLKYVRSLQFKEHLCENLGYDYGQLTEAEQLGLVLYVIESEFNFEGHGIYNAFADFPTTPEITKAKRLYSKRKPKN